MTPPEDRFEYWIRFVCASGFFGLVSFLVGLRFMDSIEMVPLVGVGLGVTLLVSHYLARKGDEGWHRLLSPFRFWW